MKQTFLHCLTMGAAVLAATGLLRAADNGEVVLPFGTNHVHAALYTHGNLYRCGGHYAFGQNIVVRFPVNASGVPDGRRIASAQLGDGALYQPGAVVIGDRLYVLGGKTQHRGAPDTNEARIWMMPLAPDGTPGTPVDVGVMPETIHPFGTGAVARENRIYVAGGWGKRSCYHCDVKPDGTLTPWIPFAKLPTTLMAQNNLVLLGNTLYAAGAVGHQMKSEKIFSCRLDADGVPAAKWRRETNLPVQAYDGVLLADAGALLYFDGETGKIFRARPEQSGNLGEWTEVGALPRPGLFGFSVTRIPAGYLLLGALTAGKPHKNVPGTLIPPLSGEKVQ